MNKTELIDKVREKASRTESKADIEDILNTTFQVIMDEVADGVPVQIIGFGTFERAERAARCGRNPQTGKEMQIAACCVPKFKPGKAFKDLVK